MNALKLFFLINSFCLLAPGHIIAQNIQWTSFKSLTDSLRLTPKPILIFIHTDWCKYCELMQQNTFTNEEVIEELNTNFYTLALDAEKKEELIFLNRKYHFQSNGLETGTHQLAAYLGTKNGVLSFPSAVFIDSNQQVIDVQPGFLSPADLLTILREVKALKERRY